MSAVSRRRNAAAAKEAKMKKVAIVGGVLLLGVIGFQAPKVLKSLHSSSGAGETVAAPVEPATPPASLTDEMPPTAGAGQLVSFSLFSAKDPFVQQVAVDTNPDGGSSPGYKRPGSTNPAVATPTSTTTPIEPPPPTTTATTDTTSTTTPTTTPTGATGASTTSTSTSTEPTPTGAAISTNGVCEVVPVDGTFPKATPFFRLVSVATDGGSIELGIADGSLDGGQATVTVTKGKSLTLLNKTTKVRYAIELLSGCPETTTTDTTTTDTTTTDTTTTDTTTTATTTTTTTP
jgi:hypothetical protein